MIPLIPFTWWTISSKLSAEEAYMRLLPRLEQRSWFRWGLGQYHFPFEGSASQKGFNINRVIRYRNSFLPMLYGNFTMNRDQLKIQVVAMIHPFVLVFLISILGTMVGNIRNESDSGNALRNLASIALPVYIIIQALFVYELYKAKRFLNETFQS